MKINIASNGGRTWLLDISRELEKQGHEVNFYSYVPTKRALKFGLKKECSRSYFILAIPFLALMKLTNTSNWSLFLFHYIFDLYVSWFLKPCDIFIGHSPMHVKALKKAKKKYGAKVIIERGSSHVLEQIRLLENNPTLNGKVFMPNMFVKRDLKGYKLADYVSIPSEFVKNSFLSNSVPNKKLFVNPYGISLIEFQPTKLESDQYDVIMVGQWCYRKGCDLLVEVCKKNNLSLLHVGSVTNVPFPEDKNFTHFDSVEQKELINYYKKAKVFALPSREEGFGMVLTQALVCGLPIVCSKTTGGPDLVKFTNNPNGISVMKEYSESELLVCLNNALEFSKTQKGIRSYSENVEEFLSWKSYGERYNNFITNI